MGAFIIFDIKFKTLKDRINFEKKYYLTSRYILVDEESNSFGFGAWTFLRNPELNPVYYMGFMGYADPKDILKDCLKNKINITFLAWLPVNDNSADISVGGNCG